jgi:hypothetical protein
VMEVYADFVAGLKLPVVRFFAGWHAEECTMIRFSPCQGEVRVPDLSVELRRRRTCSPNG